MSERGRELMARGIKSSDLRASAAYWRLQAQVAAARGEDAYGAEAYAAREEQLAAGLAEAEVGR
jgi:hypothetical protein